jgi:fucose permease
VLPLGSAAFFLFGVVLVVLGVCQPGITASLGLSHAGFGLLGSAMSVGIGLGVLGAGPLVDRYARRPIFFLSTLVAGAALATVEPGMSTNRAMLHIAAMGAGCGVFDTLLNAVTVERYRDRSVRPMAFLHALVPVGGIATPWFVYQLGGSSEWVSVFRAMGFAFLALSVWVACVRLPAPRGTASSARVNTRSEFMRPAFIALCIVGFGYVGVEAAFTLFTTPYAMGGLGLEEAAGSRSISAFWLGILLGRILLMLPSGSVDARVLVAGGGAAAAGVIAGVALQLEVLDWLMGFLGLALSAVFPIMITLAGRLVPSAPGKAVGLVAGLGSFGGIGLPWLTGSIADTTNIAIGFASLGLWCGLIAIAGAVAFRTHHPMAKGTHD